MTTTLARVEEARRLYDQAVLRHSRFSLPEILRRCTKCKEHAAFYVGEKEGEFLCGPCGGTVSVFVHKILADDIRQRAADAALELRGK